MGFELRAEDEVEAALRVSCFKFGPDGLRVAEAEPLPVEVNKEEDDDDIFGFGGELFNESWLKIFIHNIISLVAGGDDDEDDDYDDEAEEADEEDDETDEDGNTKMTFHTCSS